MKRQSRQSGFSIVEAIVVVAVIGVLGTASWFVYQHNKTKPTSATGGTQTTNQSSTQPTTTPTPTPPGPTVTYLDIKEWGVKLPLPSAIKDAYYVVPDGISKAADGLPSGISLSVTSLNSSCGTLNSGPTGQDNAVAGIIRVLPTDRDPVSGKLYTDLYPGGPTINGYYYAFSDLTAHRTCASQTALQAVGSAFTAAAKSAVTATAN